MCRRCRRRLLPTPFRRGGLISWGFRKGFKYTRYPIGEAANRILAHGYEWVALQIDDDGSSEDARLTGEYNRTIWPQFYEAFRIRGMLAGCWVTQGGNLWMAPANSDLAIAEVEGPGDYDGVVNVIKGVGAGPLPTCPLAVVTNFSTLTRDRVKVLTDAKFTCLPEAYINETATKTPDAMDRTARNLGWPTSQPVAGVYPTRTCPVVPSYAEWSGWPLVDYLLEYVV